MNTGISVLIRTNSARNLLEVLDRLKLQSDDEIVVVEIGKP